MGQRDGGSYSLGRWHWDEQAAELVLRSAGPERRIGVAANGRLRLRGASPVEHVLERDSAAPPFTDRIALEGDSWIVDKSAVFTECLTGLELAVAEASAFKELRRQHRVLNSRGKPALTSVEAHIATVTEGDATREVLVVDRVVGLKPGARC